MHALSDQQIFETLMDELNWDPGVCAVGIRVSVQQGCVALSGWVPDVEQRLRAEAIVRLCAGVIGVQSDLHVGGCANEASSLPLIRRVQLALSGLGCVDTDAIEVRIQAGWVTLSGLVGTEERRKHLVWMLQKLLGIREVAEADAMNPFAPA